MRIALAAVAVAASLMQCSNPATDRPATDGSPLHIAVDGGRVAGFSESGVDRFYGIPFAAPPVGDLRWRPPQPVVPWDTVLQATEFKAGPTQHNVWGDMRYRSPGFSEDCLYLNVWAPEGPRTGLPVLLYFYGGGFIAGDASETRYDGAALARDGIIVVTANYRLNVFGFLAHPELSAEAPSGHSGNYGLLDQVMALRWVRDNIAAVGGDPERITVGGESAGSMSTSILAASPLSRKLIAGAIGQSGAAIAPTLVPVPQSRADSIGEAFAKTTDAQDLAQLRDLPAEVLYAAYRAAEMPDLPIVLDGQLLPESVEAIYAKGRAADVPLLVGWNSREAAPDRFADADTSAAAYAAALTETFGDQAPAMLAALPHETVEEREASARQLAGDLWVSYGAWRWSELHAVRTRGRVWRYLYDQPRPGQTGGAPHAAEIPYAMGNLYIHPAYEWTDTDRDISQVMRGYFANFVKTGNPNGPGLATWRHIETDTAARPVLVIAPETRLEYASDAHYPTLTDYFAE